jgi:serine/threonine protein kinase/Tfp pilus assembly protein PilF
MKNNKHPSERYDDIFLSGKGKTKLSTSEETSVSTTRLTRSIMTELVIGSVFAGRYQVLKQLGKGGMGKVYVVWDSEINEEVAIKLLNPEISGDEEIIKRFRNELKLARKISHRNVCRMFDLSKEGETYYITMEYVPGQDLKSLIKKNGPLSPGKTVFIAKQLCQGLAEAHKSGIIHCDLKPQNIMIDGEGNVRIVDFGVARSHKATGMTESGFMIGTPEYMSIEQVEGKKVDQSSDIYSLGVILYEMLTGKVPFKADTPLSTALKHVTQAPSDPREVNAEIPKELSSIILKCLAKNMEKRYGSAEELLTELNNIDKDISTTQFLSHKRITSSLRQMDLIFNKRKLFIPALALLALLFMVTYVWQPFSHKEVVPVPATKPSLAVLPFHTSSGNQSLDIWRKGISLLLATDLRQSKFIRVLEEERISNILAKLNLLGVRQYSADELQKVAIQTGADHILVGSFFKSDHGLTIAAAVQNQPSGLVISSSRVNCKGEEEVFNKIDGLTEKIKHDLGISSEQVAKDSDKKVKEITTSSYQAYKYYIQGLQNQIQGHDPHKTLKLMEKATTTDAEFAMAYRTMAKAYGELGLFSEMWNSLRKAYELKHRLSLRDFLLIQGELYSMSEQTYDEAIDSYNKLLKNYPQDRDANLNLGLMLCYDLEKWDEAIDRIEVLIKNQEVSSEPYIAQAEAYMAKGMYNRGREVLENYLKSFPDQIWIHESISNLYLCQGNLDLSQSEADKALSKNPYSVSPSLMGDIYHCSGDLIEAEKEYKKMYKDQEPISEYHTHFKLAALYLSQGKFEESTRMIKQMIALTKKNRDPEQKMWSHSYLARIHLASKNPDFALKDWEKASRIAAQENLDWSIGLHLKGLIYLSMRSTEKAQKTSYELKDMLQKRKNEKFMRYYYHLKGSIELEKQDFSQAITYLNKALTWLPSQHSQLDDHAMFIYPLATAYYKAGDLEKAREQFKNITLLTTGRLSYGDIFARSLYMLGKICQEKDQEEEAIKHFARFTKLWEKSDPGIAELEDAKKRLNNLRLKNKKLAKMGN